MKSRLAELFKQADSAKTIFILSGPAAPFAYTAEVQEPLPQRIWMFGTTATTVHPLARMSQAILYYEAIDGALTPEQIAWIDWPCGLIEGSSEVPGVESFCAAIQSYRNRIDAARKEGKPLPVF
jgi:hypothetical protein